jgi:peptidoglycan/LPS O-acetylase OafA/YrhL
MPSHSHLAYRADIDGLRAVAVSGVIAFHAFPTLAQGGFVGVDVFFVISGYLISTFILRDLQQGTFSFTSFYARRIRRIFPALILVLVFCLALGWLVLIGDEYKMLGKHVGAGAGFIANFALWNESGYFDTAAELKPLLHLWSLGIEEQFYIVWPALLVLIYRFRLNALVVLVVLGLVSFWLNISNVAQDRAWVFFLPQARLWELMIGGVCAWITLHHRNSLSRLTSSAVRSSPGQKQVHVSDVASIVGVLLIAFGMFGLNRFDAFPGWWATIPVLGSALVIFAGPDALANRTILSHRLLVFVGLISFPLYLWHWPLLVFARILRGWQPGVLPRIIIVAVSLALAWLTFEFVEKRIRRRSQWAVTALLVGLIGFVGWCGYLVVRFDGLDFRFKDLANISQVRRDWEFTAGGGPDLKLIEFSESRFLQQKGNGIGRILLGVALFR